LCACALFDQFQELDCCGELNVAKMVDRHQQDMEGWGVYLIFKEAGRLLYQHIQIFRPFILAFMLLVALILFLEVIGIAWLLTWAVDQVQPYHMVGAIFGHHHHHHFGFHAFHATFLKVLLLLSINMCVKSKIV